MDSDIKNIFENDIGPHSKCETMTSRGISSIGRARALQARGTGIETRILQIKQISTKLHFNKMRSISLEVRTPRCGRGNPGSNPGSSRGESRDTSHQRRCSSAIGFRPNDPILVEEQSKTLCVRESSSLLFVSHLVAKNIVHRNPPSTLIQSRA